MTRSDTWMPLYIGDYLADTMHLSGAQHGAYLLLIMHYWRTGPLLDNDNDLAAIARTDRKTWIRDVGPAVRRFFGPSGGHLHHKRIDFEIAKAEQNSSKRRDAANARWEQAASKRNANASDLHGSSISNAYDPRGRLPSPRKEERTVLRTDAGGVVGEPLPARDRLWGEGTEQLRTLTGLSKDRAKGLIGKWLKTTKDDCAAVLSCLSEATDLRPIDPVAWLEKAIEARSDLREGVADQLSREFNFSIHDLPNETTLTGGRTDDRSTTDRAQLAHATQATHPPRH